MRKLIAVCFGIGLGAVASGAAVVLQNDGFIDGANVAFQAGFAADEMAAVTLGPPTHGYQVQYIYLLWGPSGPNQNAILNIWQDSGGTNPGPLLHSEVYDLPATSNQFVQIDLTAANIRVPQGTAIRVGIELIHSGFPSVGGDDDGTYAAARNWIWSSGTWAQANTFLVFRDWILRAEVLEIPFEDGFESGDTSAWSATAP